MRSPHMLMKQPRSKTEVDIQTDLNHNLVTWLVRVFQLFPRTDYMQFLAQRRMQNSAIKRWQRISHHLQTAIDKVSTDLGTFKE